MPDTRYDARTPVAVFLGPSLEQETARAILPANYYPPVRMGDVYRLLATGIRLIVIVDGVFHAAAPVWPREILAALQEGITVVGCSSMGALRAVELAPYGMIGHGTVYRWYADGRIEGDDEVALLHADADQRYGAVSEPLVNMRDALERACRAGVIGSDACDEMLGWSKASFYGHRTYEALLASPPFLSLPQAGRHSLRAFLAEHRGDLKRDDALQTLRLCAERGEAIGALADPRLVPYPGVETPIEVLSRGALTDAGHLVRLLDFVRLAAKDQRAVQEILARASRRFFLLRWMVMHDVTLPVEARVAFHREWRRRHADAEPLAWLAANGLTARELDREVTDRAAEAWLLTQDPSAHGLSGDAPSAFLLDCARRCGIDVPPGTSEAAQADWLVEQTPLRFGYVHWSPDIAFTRELQVTGKIAEMAKMANVAEPVSAG